MKKQNLLYAVAALAFILISVSCEKDKGDTQAPTIELKGPKNGDTLWVGTHIHFEAEFADNVELRSYKIDIHSNFNNHSHKSTTHDHNDLKEWKFQQSWDFEAGLRNAHIHHHSITIPETVDGHEVATGKYHFMVYCIDKAGNESWVAVEVVIAEDHDDDHDDHDDHDDDEGNDHSHDHD
jgi:hypothetical protein